MNFFESESKFLKTLTENLGNPDLAENFLSKIISVSDRYELKVGELRELYNLIDKALEEEMKQDKFLNHLTEKIGIREDELAEVAVFLEDIIRQIQKESDKKQ